MSAKKFAIKYAGHTAQVINGSTKATIFGYSVAENYVWTKHISYSSLYKERKRRFNIIVVSSVNDNDRVGAWEVNKLNVDLITENEVSYLLDILNLK